MIKRKQVHKLRRETKVENKETTKEANKETNKDTKMKMVKAEKQIILKQAMKHVSDYLRC